MATDQTRSHDQNHVITRFSINIHHYIDFMYLFHKANIVGESAVYVVYYINDQPVRLSIFLITNTIIINIHSINISPVVTMKRKPDGEGSTNAD